MKKHIFLNFILTVLIFSSMLLVGCSSKVETTTTDTTLKPFDETDLENSYNDYVKKANYPYKLVGESYYAYLDKSRLVSIKDIVAPYINLKGEDAKKVNDKIKNIFDSVIEKYNENFDTEFFTTLQYGFFDNTKSTNDKNKYISIAINTISEGTSTPVLDYKTFNFNVNDINNPKLMNIQEILSRHDMDKEYLLNFAKDYLYNIIHNTQSPIEHINYVNESMKLLEKSIKEENLNLYIDREFFTTLFSKYINYNVGDGIINYQISFHGNGKLNQAHVNAPENTFATLYTSQIIQGFDTEIDILDKNNFNFVKSSTETDADSILYIVPQIVQFKIQLEKLDDNENIIQSYDEISMDDNYIFSKEATAFKFKINKKADYNYKIKIIDTQTNEIRTCTIPNRKSNYEPTFTYM